MAPTTATLAWSTDLSELGDGAIALVNPPTITMTLTVELGVVFSGADVSGTVTLPVSCTARGEWLELATDVDLTATPPPATPPAEPVDASPTYTG